MLPSPRAEPPTPGGDTLASPLSPCCHRAGAGPAEPRGEGKPQGAGDGQAWGQGLYGKGPCPALGMGWRGYGGWQGDSRAVPKSPPASREPQGEVSGQESRAGRRSPGVIRLRERGKLPHFSSKPAGRSGDITLHPPHPRLSCRSYINKPLSSGNVPILCSLRPSRPPPAASRHRHRGLSHSHPLAPIRVHCSQSTVLPPRAPHAAPARSPTSSSGAKAPAAAQAGAWDGRDTAPARGGRGMRGRAQAAGRKPALNNSGKWRNWKKRACGSTLSTDGFVRSSVIHGKKALSAPRLPPARNLGMGVPGWVGTVLGASPAARPAQCISPSP